MCNKARFSARRKLDCGGMNEKCLPKMQTFELLGCSGTAWVGSGDKVLLSSV